MMRLLVAALFLWSGLPAAVRGGELYYTGFENFPTGNNTIAGTGSGGTDGWTGSTAHLALGLSGVDAETDHLVAGIGNAAFIGGNDATLPPNQSASYRTVNVRRALGIDPVASGQELVQFRVNFGIKDSTPAGFPMRRDNFEFAFYNQSGQLIAFLQFDNSSVDPDTSLPTQAVLRSVYNSALARWEKADTATVFYYDLLMELVVRINFRTNRWTASLDGVAIFADEVFHAGSLARNLGFVAAQMQIVNPVGGGTGSYLLPGDNYMLFDDVAVRIDPLPEPIMLDPVFDGATGAVRLTWLTEALYRYQVQYSPDLATWHSDLPDSLVAATATGVSPVFSDIPGPATPRRHYRVLRLLP